MESTHEQNHMQAHLLIDGWTGKEMDANGCLRMERGRKRLSIKPDGSFIETVVRTGNHE